LFPGHIDAVKSLNQDDFVNFLDLLYDEFSKNYGAPCTNSKRLLID